MSIFTDVVSTFSKSVLSKILLYVFLFLCFAYVANSIGGWLSDKFTKEPTREELAVQNAQQNSVIETQEQALGQKDETIAAANELTKAAIRSMEDYSTSNVAATKKSEEIKANLTKAETINKAEIIKITHTEPNEAARLEKLRAADTRLAEAQNLEIEAAYQEALRRSHLAP